MPSVPVLVGPARGHRFNAIGSRSTLRLMAGRYEPAVTSFLRDALRASSVFADVGAHHGYFVRVALRVMPVDGHVVAFEPDSRCDLSAFAPDRVTVRTEALGAERGSATLIAAPGACGQLGDVADNGGARSTVAVRSLDAMVSASEVPRPDVLKVDVEGAELDVLAGAADTLLTVRSLVVECHSMPLLRDVLARVVDDFGWVRVTEGGDYLGPPTVLARRA